MPCSVRRDGRRGATGGEGAVSSLRRSAYPWIQHLSTGGQRGAARRDRRGECGSGRHAFNVDRIAGYNGRYRLLSCSRRSCHASRRARCSCSWRVPGRRRLRRRLLRLGAQELAHLRALGVPPVRQDADVPADAEMLHAHLEIALRLAGIAQLDARVQALLERGLDGLGLGGQHVGMVVLRGLADAHGEVRGAELHHVDARHRQDGVEIVHARLLLDHDGDHDLVQRIDIGGRAALRAPCRRRGACRRRAVRGRARRAPSSSRRAPRRRRPWHPRPSGCRRTARSGSPRRSPASPGGCTASARS